MLFDRLRTKSDPDKIKVGDNRPLTDRLIDKISIAVFLPIIAVGAVLYFFGFKIVFIAALIVGCIVWSYWGRRIEARDGKLALIVDVEGGTVAPLIIGRSRWSKAAKQGRPYLTFRTPAGLSVEVVQSYDPNTNTVIYPPAGDYSDVFIASIPDRYGDLINELTKLKKENMADKTEIDLKSVEMARAHNVKLSSMIDDLLIPKETEK